MNRILSYFRHNRFKVIGIIIAIILALGLIRTANNMYAEKSDDSVKKPAVEINKNNQKRIGTERKEKLINDFLNTATAGNYSDAYNYLSKECKENLYPTEKEFIQKYCKEKSIKNKTYSVEQENEISEYTYRISLNNTLSAGSRDTRPTTDYYTIVIDEDNDIKLNINSFLKIKELETTNNSTELEIKIKKIKLYTDHQEIEVEYKNNTSKKISIGTDVIAIDGQNNQNEQTNVKNNESIEANKSETITYRFNVNYKQEVKQINFVNVNGKSIEIKI